LYDTHVSGQPGSQAPALVAGWLPVASLRLVSPGTATDGVAYFSLEKLTTFFIVIALCKVMTFLAVVSSQLPILTLLAQCLSKFNHKK